MVTLPSNIIERMKNTCIPPESRMALIQQQWEDHAENNNIDENAESRPNAKEDWVKPIHGEILAQYNVSAKLGNDCFDQCLLSNEGIIIANGTNNVSMVFCNECFNVLRFDG